jgi:hypothetical protein
MLSFVAPLALGIDKSTRHPEKVTHQRSSQYQSTTYLYIIIIVIIIIVIVIVIIYSER